MASYLVYGSMRWGKGATLAEAKRNFTRQGARLGDGYGILEFPAGTEVQGVDQMGRVHYVGAGPTETVIPARKKAARR